MNFSLNLLPFYKEDKNLKDKFFFICSSFHTRKIQTLKENKGLKMKKLTSKIIIAIETLKDSLLTISSFVIVSLVHA